MLFRNAAHVGSHFIFVYTYVADLWIDKHMLILQDFYYPEKTNGESRKEFCEGFIGALLPPLRSELTMCL